MEGMVRTSIVYPESDGKPVAETDVHIDTFIALREALRDHFRDVPQVYVAGNLLLYYEEGNPAACVAPDTNIVSAHFRKNPVVMQRIGEAERMGLPVFAFDPW